MHVSLFRADSGTNLIKQGENVKGRPCGSVAQLAECSHGKREALGSSPGRTTIFSSPVTQICSFTSILVSKSIFISELWESPWVYLWGVSDGDLLQQLVDGT